MRLALEQKRRRGVFRHVEVTLRAGHAVLALFKEILRAVLGAEVKELPQLARSLISIDSLFLTLCFIVPK
jgi:hypothetical protein